MQVKPLFRGEWLDAVPEAKRVSLAGVALLVLLFNLWQWIYRSPFFFNFFKGIDAFIGDFIEPSAIMALIASWTIFLFAFVLIRFGGLRLRDAGLDSRKLLQAVLVIAALWGACQLGIAIYEWISGRALELHADWGLDRIGFQAGRVIAYFLGVALVEELIFRGFLPPQFYLKLKKRRLKKKRAALMLAVLFSQLLFGLIHVVSLTTSGPALAVENFYWILLLSLAGTLFLLLYWRTENLLLVIGLHGLCDSPLPLFQSPISPFWILVPLVALLLVFWPLLPARWRRLPPG